MVKSAPDEQSSYSAVKGSPTRAFFLERPNRFVVLCRIGTDVVKAHLPNPGRLWELLYKDAELVLERTSASGRATDYTVVAVRTERGPVMLHTHRVNSAVAWLLARGKLIGFEDYKLKGREVTHGQHRFDLLLSGPEGEILVEVKSCTLFGELLAMFPDAPSKRAVNHVRHLGELARQGVKTAVIFAVQTPHPKFFLPDFHTDYDFARTVLAEKEHVEFLPISLEWGAEDLKLKERSNRIEIPWGVLEQECVDAGSYVSIFEIKDPKAPLGDGFYCVVERAPKDLTASMARVTRKTLMPHPTLNAIKEDVSIVGVLPIRANEDMASLQDDLAAVSPLTADGLFYFPHNPLRWKSFIDVLLKYRIGRLEQKLLNEYPGGLDGPKKCGNICT